MWEPFSSPYTVDVANPEKKKKYYGMKKFTAYEVTIVCPLHGNIKRGTGEEGLRRGTGGGGVKSSFIAGLHPAKSCIEIDG